MTNVTKSKSVLPSSPIPESPWIQTFTGKKFYPLSPLASNVDIRDVAHGLANTSRFGGHTREFYSVAQHSCEVARLCPPEDQVWGLLHDAPEAYLGDMPRPIKHHESFGMLFREAEDNLMLAICERYELDPVEPASVEEADCRLLATEKRDLLARMQGVDDLTETEWMHGKAHARPLPTPLRPLLPKDAEWEFLRLWELVTGNRYLPKPVHRKQAPTGGRGNLGPMYKEREV